MRCQVCQSTLKAGDLYCSSCGAVVPEPSSEYPPKFAAASPASGNILTVLCADLQRSTDLISELDPEAAISRLEPALDCDAHRRSPQPRDRQQGRRRRADRAFWCAACRRQSRRHGLSCGGRTGSPDQAAGTIPALQVRVGVHSGYVVAHVIEADFSSIYEAGGPAVHLVKRFESAAQAGQILASESCQSLAAGIVTFNALPPKRMEGFPALVPCYELVEISGLSRWRARSTKGFHLLSAAPRRFHCSSARRGTSALPDRSSPLVGTAGIGKSRMAHEFVGHVAGKTGR